MDINQFSQFIFTECITFTEHKGENKKRTWLLLTNTLHPSAESKTGMGDPGAYGGNPLLQQERG